MHTTRSGWRTPGMPSRASPLPQRYAVDRGFCEHRKTCGSWLACDANNAVWLAHSGDAIASKPAPTEVRG
ncbi:hypothetical protein CJU74_24105 [Pseudomonas fragi]|nr:hypothetical protein CJU74_24105 [Pseudomonas fragi]